MDQIFFVKMINNATIIFFIMLYLFYWEKKNFLIFKSIN